MIDLIGQKFGRLTAKEAVLNRNGSVRWRCICECGNEAIVNGYHLTAGRVKSCGCLRLAPPNAFVSTHGESKTRLYFIWKSMKGRCERKTDKRFESYGGRNIVVCEEWRNSYESFRDWAMANGYNNNLTLDRINNDGNYCPENCRWATTIEQANNRRNNHFLTLNGETHTIAEWSKITGVKEHTIMYRIRRGWSVERAITQAVAVKSIPTRTD